MSSCCIDLCRRDDNSHGHVSRHGRLDTGITGPGHLFTEKLIQCLSYRIPYPRTSVSDKPLDMSLNSRTLSQSHFINSKLGTSFESVILKSENMPYSDKSGESSDLGNSNQDHKFLDHKLDLGISKSDSIKHLFTKDVQFGNVFMDKLSEFLGSVNGMGTLESRNTFHCNKTGDIQNLENSDPDCKLNSVICHPNSVLGQFTKDIELRNGITMGSRSSLDPGNKLTNLLFCYLLQTLDKETQEKDITLQELGEKVKASQQQLQVMLQFCTSEFVSQPPICCTVYNFSHNGWEFVLGDYFYSQSLLNEKCFFFLKTFSEEEREIEK